MHQTGSFAAIKVHALEDAPPAVQKFVERFFAKKDIFGIPCWVAFKELSSGGSRPKGVAPSHSVDVNFFSKEGLPADMRLYDVLSKIENDPEKCFHFYLSWDDGCSGYPICAED